MPKAYFVCAVGK